VNKVSQIKVDHKIVKKRRLENYFPSVVEGDKLKIQYNLIRMYNNSDEINVRVSVLWCIESTHIYSLYRRRLRAISPEHTVDNICLS
jgi:hypothetical protein